MDNWIGISEASKILRISPNTVKKLVREGILPAYQVTGVRGLQFQREEVKKLIKRVEPVKPKPDTSHRKRSR